MLLGSYGLTTAPTWPSLAAPAAPAPKPLNGRNLQQSRN